MTVEGLWYLRQNVQVEPLVDQWYAWPHLISPATAARNLTDRHLKIMDSYISAPDVHAAAAQNPSMAGGPFVDYPEPHVDELRALRDTTCVKRQDLLELSAALGELSQLLAEKAKGYAIQPLYAEIPDVLRGYVELTYDLANQPSYRLIEPLLYGSRFYDSRAQTLMLSTISGDDRPFVLSTPRLEMPGSLHVDWTFNDPRVDRLFRLKSRGQTWPEIRTLLDIPEDRDEAWRAFFTQEPPPVYQPYTGPGARWRYFGHACILVETAGVSVLVDPVLSYTYESAIARYTYADLPDTIDFVLITHNHQDHVLLETLLQIRHKVRHVLVPRNGTGQLQDPSLRLMLERIGFENVRDIDELETVTFPNGSITGLPFLGEHADLAIATKRAYRVAAGGYGLMFAADSCNVEPRLYQHLAKDIGPIDVLFLGMECEGAPLSWIYGPLLTQRLPHAMDMSRRLSGSNYTQAIAIVDALRCRDVYVYAMGQEPWLNYVMSIKYTDQSRPIVDSNRLIDVCRARGMEAERLFGEREILLGVASLRTGAR
jgi:L-ascorbate metabolism protein UlaG (beta-lactamase superfamily)